MDPVKLAAPVMQRAAGYNESWQLTALIEQLREDGMAFVFISSELEEVVRASTKIDVMRDRRMVGSLQGEEATEDKIMYAAIH